ncbi:ABC transporter substrate-binding protein [Stutzerimonas xanthomarina]|uniref:Spermidine/putrescine transport system substrate-binding protein n=2 Tax=Stutzerimonas xanthomarina TaxID=271420 RepID=A0A1M5SX88_9GAMM|nr:spermidine/putrescine ABC transporter substrate-binding protein [Stutzerimonas xanthomarina]MCP9339847.1 spermidine/putrescine ABC transporter substrate-binding protein [Stutzerimonas xanthomarina]SEH57228.1 spermidine/putrescine transport system substrate-binding protein [Stutzerimonas xanthomarina]SHH43075.1 spermidine/putrescine transport system substrate-binding protein [Stutzerimonas xanthomarina DSM 18231]
MNNQKPFFRAPAALLALACLLLPSTALHAAQTLHLLNWEEYLSEAVIERWEAETGVKIEQVYFDSGDKRDEVLAKPDHLIDIALTELISSSRFGQRGLLDPIDEQALPNLKHVPKRWRDSCGAHSIPYLWGTLGIAYRADRLPNVPQSWADLLQPANRDEPHIIMMEDHEDILAGPLLHQGHSINTSNNDELKAAFELLQAQAPAVLTYEYVITSLRSQRYLDKADMALAYSGDQQVLNEVEGVDGEPWRYMVPKEGTLLWVDCLSVPTNGAQKALAYRFLNFLNNPQIAALNSAELGVATTNAAAKALLPEEIRQDPTIYPAEVVLRNSQVYEARPLEATQTRRRIISALINAHDAR